MSRDYHINGETLVQVKGRTDSAIGSLSELGLADSPVVVSPTFFHSDINVDAWGDAAAEVQVMLAEIRVTMSLIHFDRTVLEECVRLSQGYPSAEGRLARAGTRLGGNNARFAAGNNFVGLNLTSPIEGRPWRFYFAYLINPPFSWPVGTEKSSVSVTWRVIPYTQDPWQGGLGAGNQILYDHVLDT